jgi:hypothetical protein
LSLVTTTTARTEGVWRAASSRWTVPSTLTAKVSTGRRYEARTSGRAARWKTTSGACSARAVRTSGSWRTSPMEDGMRSASPHCAKYDGSVSGFSA